MDRAILGRYGENYVDRVVFVSGKDLELLGKELKVSRRAVYDWRRGRHSIPLKVVQFWYKKYKVELPKNCQTVSSRNIRSIAGRKGGLSQKRNFINPGTKEGRKLGGLRSLATHRKTKTRFKLLKKYPSLMKNEKMAELVGIILGDGSLTKNQLRIYLDLKRDRDYSFFVKNLIYNITGELPILRESRGNLITIEMSGKDLIRKLTKYGLVVGNKVASNFSMPDWIFYRKAWIKGALRGLFDTDGSVYMDRHRHKDKDYSSINIAYTSYSQGLLQDVEKALLVLGFNPVMGTKNSVRIRRSQQVKLFFEIIGSNNNKHLNRYLSFQKMEGCAER